MPSSYSVSKMKLFPFSSFISGAAGYLNFPMAQVLLFIR